MRWRRAAALALLSFALAASPAAAWDPEDDGWDWWWSPDPAPEPVTTWTPDPAPDWAPEPAATWTPDPEPAWNPPEPAASWAPPDPPDWSPPDPAPAWSAPEPAPIEAPAGIYYVTQTYVADVVTTQGPVTTYSTETVAESTGTYARVLESVGTGATSGYDGSAFNGRAQLGNGSYVAGTYYENFVLTAAGFASVSIVFFQDDSETALSAAPPVSAPPPTAAPAPAPAQPIAVVLPTPVSALPAPAATPPAAQLQPETPAGVSEPAEGGSSAPVAPAGASVPSAPSGTAPGSPPRVPVLRGGVSPLPQGDLLGSIDVLRGRRIALWPRATADGAPARVREWRASGELVALGPLAGAGEEPLVARWDALAPPDAGWPLRLALVVELPSGVTSEIEVPVTVVVRSPALVR